MVRHSRSQEPKDRGVKKESKPYALSTLVYCAHCARHATKYNDVDRHSRLTGRTERNGKRRYKHKTGIKCGIQNRTVDTDVLEREVGRLIKLLDVDVDSVALMTEMAIQAEKALGHLDEDFDIEEKKREVIAACQRKINAAIVLFGDGHIDVDEYRRRVEKNEREIAHWQHRTTETEKIHMELSKCVEVVGHISKLWDMANDEDRRGMAQQLFDYIIFDMDTERITNFRLKGWAERYLVMRASLYEEDFGGDSESLEDVQGLRNDLPPRGLLNTSRFTVSEAAQVLLYLAYRDCEFLPDALLEFELAY